MVLPETNFDRERAPILRYCFNVPKLGDISDLKATIGKNLITIITKHSQPLAKQCGIRPECLSIVEALDGRMTKIYDDRYEDPPNSGLMQVGKESQHSEISIIRGQS